MGFDELIGNDEVKQTLINSVTSGNILHSYLFYGIDGIGKKEFAKNFAKMILCNNKSEKIPCNCCDSCIEFDSNNNPDFFFIEPDGNSIKIDQIREMQKKILEKPIECTKKVYIIDKADSMTTEAQNCLLKTLEEPQEFIVIILVATNENYILPTVKSRCTKIFFNKIDNDVLMNYLEHKHEDMIMDKSLFNLCDGSISKAEKVLLKSDILKNVKYLVNNLEKLDELEFFNKNQFFYENKDEINLILDYFYILFFEKIRYNAYNVNGYINSMKVIQITKNKIKNSSNYDMSIDNMLIKIWEEIHEKNNRG